MPVVRVRARAPSRARCPAPAPPLPQRLLLSLSRGTPFLGPGPRRPVLLCHLPCTLRPPPLALKYTITTPKASLGEDRRGGRALSRLLVRLTPPEGTPLSSAPWLAPLRGATEN